MYDDVSVPGQAAGTLQCDCGTALATGPWYWPQTA